jgi:hypothetical protein
LLKESCFIAIWYGTKFGFSYLSEVETGVGT